MQRHPCSCYTPTQLVTWTENRSTRSVAQSDRLQSTFLNILFQQMEMSLSLISNRFRLIAQFLPTVEICRLKDRYVLSCWILSPHKISPPYPYSFIHSFLRRICLTNTKNRLIIKNVFQLVISLADVAQKLDLSPEN